MLGRLVRSTAKRVPITVGGTSTGNNDGNTGGGGGGSTGNNDGSTGIHSRTGAGNNRRTMDSTTMKRRMTMTMRTTVMPRNCDFDVERLNAADADAEDKDKVDEYALDLFLKLGVDSSPWFPHATICKILRDLGQTPSKAASEEKKYETDTKNLSHWLGLHPVLSRRSLV